MAEGRIKEVFIEKTVLASLDHPGIIKFYTSFGSNAKLYLLMEYSIGGSLDTYLERKGSLNLQEVWQIIAEIVDALAYLREKKIVHRDLKPGNILLDKQRHIKLCDFATSKVFNEEIENQIQEA
jgi:serine/threonine-protein kinase ULK4